MYGRLAGSALAILLACTAPSAVAADDVLVASVRGHLDISADGRVEAHGFAHTLGRTVDASLAKTVQGWRFEPVIENGRAIPVRGLLRIDLRAEGSADDVAIRIVDVAFYDPPPAGAAPRSGTAGNSRGPALVFPFRAQDHRTGGRVKALMRFDADGRVREVAVTDITLHSTTTLRSSDQRTVAKLLSQETLAKVRQWRFPAEAMAALDPVDPMGTMVVDFALPEAVWTRATPMPVTLPDWALRAMGTQVAELDSEGNRESQLRRIDADAGREVTL